MYCNNCGTQFEDNQAFCPNCGTAVEATKSAENGGNDFTPDNKGGINKFIPLIGIGVAVVIVIVIIALIAGSGGYKKVIKNQFKYLEKSDMQALSELGLPKDIYDDFSDERFEDADYDLEEYLEVHKAASEAFWEALEEEGKVKLEYEIKKAEKLDDLDKLKKDMKEWDIKDLDDFIDLMDEVYEDFDFDSDKIKQAYAVEYKYILNVDGKKEATDNITTIVYKYKGDWYMFDTMSIYTMLNELDEEDFEDVYEAYKDETDELNK